MCVCAHVCVCRFNMSRAIELPKHPLASVGGDWQIKVGRCVIVVVCTCVYVCVRTCVCV